jgi:hypothetical protein
VPAPQGLVWFPGVQQPIRGQYTLSHGITPGIATIDMLPQADFVGEGGTLRFTFGDVEILFPDCKVDLASLRYDRSGFVIGLSVLDRRWKWAFGQISGSYNTRREDGRPIPERVKEARDMCALCLDAMNETDYDVSQVPSGVFPTVDWEYDNPAQSLAALADDTGCRVVMRLDNTVAIIPTGTGAALPDLPVIEADSLTINPPERPDAIAFVCGRTRFQMDIKLRAVGLDTDGQVKPIYQLSYMPASGWSNAERRSFTDVGASLPDTPDGRKQKQFLRTLALDTVWRWYQILLELPDSDGNPAEIEIPGFTTVTKLKGLLLLDEQVELMQDIDGFLRVRPAEVIGVFADLRLSMGNVPFSTHYWRGFSIDAERGLVQFNDQVFMYPTLESQDQGSPEDEDDSDELAEEATAAAESGGETGTIQEAALLLRTSFYVRDPDTWAWQHYVRRRDFGTSYGTGDKLYKHDESFLAVHIDETVSGDPVVTTNQDAINTEADTYLDAALGELQTTLPQDRAYSGLVAIAPDGAIQQVSWQVSSDGTCSTRASRNSEFSVNVPLYRTRRFFEFLRNNRVRRLEQKVNDLAREISFRPPRSD